MAALGSSKTGAWQKRPNSPDLGAGEEPVKDGVQQPAMVPPHDQSFVNVRCSPAAWPPSEVVNLEAFHPDTYLVLTRY